MRKLTSFFLGAIVVACAAYLSWPMASEFPAPRPQGTIVAPRSAGKPVVPVHDVNTYEVTEPMKSIPSA